MVFDHTLDPPQLRAVAEVYSADDTERMSVDEFVVAWDKVMNATASTSADRSAQSRSRSQSRSACQARRAAASRSKTFRVLVRTSE